MKFVSKEYESEVQNKFLTSISLRLSNTKLKLNTSSIMLFVQFPTVPMHSMTQQVHHISTIYCIK